MSAPRLRQFTVFDNPVVKARRRYPFVAVMQNDLVDTGLECIVATLVPPSRLGAHLAEIVAATTCSSVCNGARRKIKARRNSAGRMVGPSA